MSRRRHTLELTRSQHLTLQEYLQRPGLVPRQCNRAHVLLQWDAGIAAAGTAQWLGMTEGRVYALRRAFQRQGFRAYLNASPQGGAPTKLTPRVKTAIARLVTQPSNRAWTPRRLADHLVLRGYVDSISAATVWKELLALRQSA